MKQRLFVVSVALLLVVGVSQTWAADGYGTNREAAMKAVWAAFTACDVPADSVGASWTITGYPPATELMQGSAPSYLASRGVLLTSDESAAVRYTIRVDTLAVVVKKNGFGNIERSTIARVAIRRDAGDDYQIWTGADAHLERIPYDKRFVATDDGPYVEMSDTLHAVVQPVVTGVAMTVFAWSLYSYRN